MCIVCVCVLETFPVPCAKPNMLGRTIREGGMWSEFILSDVCVCRQRERERERERERDRERENLLHVCV
jgi:hypothetical protein